LEVRGYIKSKLIWE